MNNNAEKREDPQDHRTDTDFIQNVSSALRYSIKVLDNWLPTFRVLPRVDDKGNSDCSFAERLYANKEEQEKELIKRIEELRKYDRALAREMERVHRNMSVISADAGRVHADPTKDRYEQARHAEAFAHNKLAETRKDIQKMIAKLEEALRLSRTKKWPLGEPRQGGEIGIRLPVPNMGGPISPEPRGSQAFVGPISNPMTNSPIATGPISNGAMNGLITMGPIGGAGQ